MYKIKLESAGFEVKTAGDGLTGLDLCKQFKPDLALVDVMMPRMNGLEMIEKMQSTDEGKKPLVMLLTNLSQSESKVQDTKARVDDYGVKAYLTPTQLLEKIKQLLNGKVDDQ